MGLPVEYIAFIITVLSLGCCALGVVYYWVQTGGMPTLLAFEPNEGLPAKEPKDDDDAFENPMMGEEDEIDEADIERVDGKKDDGAKDKKEEKKEDEAKSKSKSSKSSKKSKSKKKQDDPFENP